MTLRFWLIWTVVSSLSATVMLLVGLIPAYLLGVLFVAGLSVPISAPLLFPAAAAVVGLVIGATTGTLQSLLLPWERERRHRWFQRSMLGWAAGAGLGCTAAIILAATLYGDDASETIFGRSAWMVLATTPVSGVVLGLALRPVPSDPRARVWWWLAGHVVAVSGGWLLGMALGLKGGSNNVIAPSLALASGWYGAVSGLLMLPIIARQRSAPEPPVSA
jgi:hypothetical protein